MSERFQVWTRDEYGAPEGIRGERARRADAEDMASQIARSGSNDGGAVSVYVFDTEESEIVWAAGEKAAELESTGETG